MERSQKLNFRQMWIWGISGRITGTLPTGCGERHRRRKERANRQLLRHFLWSLHLPGETSQTDKRAVSTLTKATYGGAGRSKANRPGSVPSPGERVSVAVETEKLTDPLFGEMKACFPARWQRWPLLFFILAMFSHWSAGPLSPLTRHSFHPPPPPPR